MLDSFLPNQSNTFNNSGLNLEQSDDIFSQPANILPPRTISGFSQDAINFNSFVLSGDDSLTPLNLSLAPQSGEDLKSGISSVDAVTGEVLSNKSDSNLPISPIVEQAVRSAQDYLSGLATDPDFSAKMNLAFGNSWNAEVGSNLVQEFAKGDFRDIPAIEILPSAAINGANGAFAKLTNTIYLAKEFVEQNAGNVGAITSVLLEETGHFIDSKINVSDAAGDEGDIFARVVEGKAISAGELRDLKGEDDTAIVILDGQAIQIEQAKKIGSDRVIDLIRQERGSWVNNSNDAEIFQSKGDWTFNKRIQLPNMDLMNGDFVNLISGDFDGNGITDFIRQEKGTWVNGVNDAQVYLGAGNGTFKTPIQMTDMGAMNGNFANLVAGDFNGDFYTDIIRQEKGTWVDGSRDAEIYLSNGNGTFKNPVLMNNASAINGNFVNLIVGDFTGGGADDIIRQEKGTWVDGNNDVQYYTFSQGNFKFQANVPDMGVMNGNFVNLVAGDFNGDRVTDLIRQEKGAWVDGKRDAEIYVSNKNWGFKSVTVMNNASVMNGDNVNLIVGDLTGGGADDIVRQEKNGWVDGKNDVEFLTYFNGNFTKVKDAPNMSELNGNYVTLVPGLFGTSSAGGGSPNPFNFQEYFQRLYGNTGSSSRGFSEHSAIDSTDGTNPFEVRALVGGRVDYVKSNGVTLTGVNANADWGYNPITRRWETASQHNNQVRIWNPDLNRSFTYLHFGEVRVKQGDNVNPGDLIGIEGSTGWSTGRHTHLEVRNSNGVKEDPLVILGNARGLGILDKNYRA